MEELFNWKDHPVGVSLLPVKRRLNRGVENAMVTYCASDVTTAQRPGNVWNHCLCRVGKYNRIWLNLDMNLLAWIRASGLNICGLAKEGWKNQGVCGTECVECPAIQDKSVVCRALGKAETEQPSLAIPVGPGLSTEPLFDIVDWYCLLYTSPSPRD